MKQQGAAVPLLGVGRAPPDAARAVEALARTEIVVGGMPATSSVQSVTDFFDKHGIVITCKRQLSTCPGVGIVYKLRMATTQEAKWCVENLISMKVAKELGLDSPLIVRPLLDSGEWWTT